MPGQVWEVIGGGANNGILVRRGRSTVSSSEAARLATGARIEELALDGDRLHYKLLEGSGPHTGWVSICVTQRGAPPKELVVRVSPSGVAFRLADEPLACKERSEATFPGTTDGNAATLGCHVAHDGHSADGAAAGVEAAKYAGGEAARAGGNKAAQQRWPADGEVARLGAGEAPLQHRLLPQELPETCAASSILRRGARQLRSVFCRPDDDNFFQALRVELLRVEVEQDQRIKQTEAANKLKSGAGPLKNGWSQSKRSPMHTFVLNKLAELMDVDGLAWWTNLYEEASVDCKFHHDWSSVGSDADNPNLKPDISMIASFGATRDFTLRHAATGREFSFCQENGDVIAFDNQVDEDFLHGLHPAEGRGLPRIAVVMVGQRTKLPKPLLPEFVGVWRPAEHRPPEGRWQPRLLQFSGKFLKGGAGPHHALQDKDGREVLAPWELDWFIERGSGMSHSRGMPGPGADAFSMRGVVKDVVVWLERSVDQAMFDVVMKNLIVKEGSDRIENIEFHLVPWADTASPRIPKLIRLVWRGQSEDDISEKHEKLVARLQKDLGLQLQ